MRCCELSAKDGWEYAWVDTCCIDKTSSAELSEAINSMHRWYQKADICYAFLADVPSDVDLNGPTSAFRSSRWFTRGWTLQELIAPKFLTFLSRDWQDIGSKFSLKGLVSEITGIHVEALIGEDLERWSVAQRMSWAANRSTSRDEDTAYSLMGLFDVNMPMLYGEGKKALMRLQEEIMEESEDDSIFVWFPAVGDFAASTGLLAPSPKSFHRSSNVREHLANVGIPRLSFSSKQNRIELQTSLLNPSATTLRENELGLSSVFQRGSNIILVILNCTIDASQDRYSHTERLLGLFLTSFVSNQTQQTRYQKIKENTIYSFPISKRALLEQGTISACKEGFRLWEPSLSKAATFHFKGDARHHSPKEQQSFLHEAYPIGDQKWESGMSKHANFLTIGVRCQYNSSIVFDVLLCNFDDGLPRAVVTEPLETQSLPHVFENITESWENSPWPPSWVFGADGGADSVVWQHSSGQKVSVIVRKRGKSWRPLPTTDERGLIMDRLFLVDQGHVRECKLNDSVAQATDTKYSVTVKMD